MTTALSGLLALKLLKQNSLFLQIHFHFLSKKVLRSSVQFHFLYVTYENDLNGAIMTPTKQKQEYPTDPLLKLSAPQAKNLLAGN